MINAQHPNKQQQICITLEITHEDYARKKSDCSNEHHASLLVLATDIRYL